MNKKLVFSLIAVVLLSVTVVSAADGTVFGPVTDFIEKNLGVVFVNFADHIDVSFYIWMKVMLCIFLFSLFFALASVGPIKNVLGEKNKNIRVVVSLVISLISVIMIPNAMVEAIAKSYGIVGSFIFIGLPVVGILFAIYLGFPVEPTAERTPEKCRVNHIIRAVLFYLLATVINNFVAASALVPGWSTIPGWHEWASFAYSICWIMVLWNLGAAIFSFGADTEVGQSLGDWFSNFGKGGGAGPVQPYPKHLRKFINEIGLHAQRLENNYRVYMRVGNTVLAANHRNPLSVNPNDVRQMRSLEVDFTNHVQIINNNNTQLVNDPQFNNLSVGDKNRLAREITRATTVSIQIYAYTINFFQRYAQRLPP